MAQRMELDDLERLQNSPDEQDIHADEIERLCQIRGIDISVDYS